MEVKHLEAEVSGGPAATLDAVGATRRPVHHLAGVWVARPMPDQQRIVADDVAGPRVRRHKATRCRHCSFCHPPGGLGAVRACGHPDHSDLVIGDQMACGSFIPSPRVRPKEASTMQTLVSETRTTKPVVADRLCGACRYHMPYATDSRSVCTCPVSSFYEDEVFTGQLGCAGFAGWPEGSGAPLFLSAMRH